VEGGKGDLQAFKGFGDVFFKGFAEDGVGGLQREVVEEGLKVGFKGFEIAGWGERHFEKLGCLGICRLSDWFSLWWWDCLGVLLRV
jgi:hypothetical protein